MHRCLVSLDKLHPVRWHQRPQVVSSKHEDSELRRSCGLLTKGGAVMSPPTLHDALVALAQSLYHLFSHMKKKKGWKQIHKSVQVLNALTLLHQLRPINHSQIASSWCDEEQQSALKVSCWFLRKLLVAALRRILILKIDAGLCWQFSRWLFFFFFYKIITFLHFPPTIWDLGPILALSKMVRAPLCSMTPRHQGYLSCRCSMCRGREVEQGGWLSLVQDAFIWGSARTRQRGLAN